MGMSMNVTGALPMNWQDLYVIDNNSIITGFYSTIYGWLYQIYLSMYGVCAMFYSDENEAFISSSSGKRLPFLFNSFVDFDANGMV